MKTVGIHTLGCRVNQYESVAIAEELTRRGFIVQKDTDACDFHIINTCAVTAESQRQSRQTARHFASFGKTAVLGCASQNEKQTFLSIPNVFYVGGCSDKMAVVDAICAEDAQQTDAVSDMQDAVYDPMELQGKSDLFSSCRAFLKIQDGCNGKCSYCVIPSLRGKSRIRDAQSVLEEAKRLVRTGYHEVVLTGIEVSAYPMDALCGLIRDLDGLYADGLYRVRFGSLSPRSLRAEFLQTVADSRNAMPHLHLSLQSGSDRILARMRRPYNRTQALEGIRLAREILPRVQMSADFITGFPTETEEDYLQTERFVQEANLMHVHAFPYSERNGTEAASMEGSVPKEERKARLSRLLAFSGAQKKAILETFYGKQVTVLTEQIKNGVARGHTEEFVEITFPTDGVSAGELYTLTVLGERGGKLLGSHPIPCGKKG